MKKNLEILDYEDKKSQGGKRYVRFKTSDGWMSCFDNKTCEDLKTFEGKTASVEVITSGDFQNIKKCYGKESDEDKEEIEVKKVERKSKDFTTMYVSYAKDIFCVLAALNSDKSVEEKMSLSISLVKQAKEAFE